MKKMIVIGLICILVGVVICGAAYAMRGNADLKDTNVSFSGNDVNNINISAGIAHIRILKSADNSNEIVIKAEDIILEDFKCEIKNDDTLKISYNPSSVKFWFITLPSFGSGIDKAKINIYIPEGKVFNEFIFDGGVGKIEAEQINAQSIKIDGGVGEYDVRNITTGSLKVNGGVGSIKINGVINGDTRIDCGVGSVKLSGQANGDIRIKGGVGSINMDLTGNVGDYNIKADKGIGSIKLNGSKMPDSVRNGGKYDIDVDAGVGSIDINIK